MRLSSVMLLGALPISFPQPPQARGARFTGNCSRSSFYCVAEIITVQDIYFSVHLTEITLHSGQLSHHQVHAAAHRDAGALAHTERIHQS